jgi:tetratricopeptide (TPR) repeat protein
MYPRILARSVAGLLALAGLAGIGGCASAPVPPEEAPFQDPMLVQQDGAARAAFADGNYERAARFYELALTRARATDHGSEVAKAAYNRGACLLLLKQAEPARACLREASFEFNRLGQDASPAWLLEARAARLAGDTAAVTSLVEQLLSQGRNDSIRLQAWLIRGTLAAEAGQSEAARLALKEARRRLTDDPALRAGVAGLAGLVALSEQKPADAALSFDKESAFLQRAARWNDMAESLRRAGEAHAQAGQPRDAALRFYRAARSLAGQGSWVPALQSVERALASAQAAGDEALLADSSRLLEEIRQAVGVARAAGQVE